MVNKTDNKVITYLNDYRFCWNSDLLWWENQVNQSNKLVVLSVDIFVLHPSCSSQ